MPNNRNLALLAVAASTPGLMAASSSSVTPVPAAATDQLHSVSTAVEADARSNLKTQILAIDPLEKVREVGGRVLLTRTAAATTPVVGAGAGPSSAAKVGRTNTDIPECHALSGNWPVNVTGSQGYDGAHCLELDLGNASLDGKYAGGFEVISGDMLVYLGTTGGNGDPATLLFSAHATAKGTVGKGAFEFIQGGTSYDSGTATFGTKNDC